MFIALRACVEEDIDVEYGLNPLLSSAAASISSRRCRSSFTGTLASGSAGLPPEDAVDEELDDSMLSLLFLDTAALCTNHKTKQRRPSINQINEYTSTLKTPADNNLIAAVLPLTFSRCLLILSFHCPPRFSAAETWSALCISRSSAVIGGGFCFLEALFDFALGFGFVFAGACLDCALLWLFPDCVCRV